MGPQEEEKDPLGTATEPFTRSAASASTRDMMTARILFASIVLGLVAGGGVGLMQSAVGGQRAPAADTVDVPQNGIAVGGLIANETFSVVGARFSRAFQDKWTEPEGVANYRYTIRLQENPVPRFGAQVLVTIEGTMIFQGYLRPNRRQIQQAAQQAVQRATLYLQKYYEPREVY